MCISFEDILVCKKKKIQIHHVISLWRRDLKTEQKFSVRHLHFFSFKISSFLSFQLKFFIGIEGLRGGSAGKSTLSPSLLTLVLSLSHTWERERESSLPYPVLWPPQGRHGRGLPSLKHTDTKQRNRCKIVFGSLFASIHSIWYWVSWGQFLPSRPWVFTVSTLFPFSPSLPSTSYTHNTVHVSIL